MGSKLLLIASLLLLSRPVHAAELKFAPEVGLAYERLDRVQDSTRIVKPDTILTQKLEMGTREVGRVMDVSGGEVRIASQALSSALKVNGKTREGGIPGANQMRLRVFSDAGELVRAPNSDLVARDVREMAIRLPGGEPAAGQRWRQTFALSAGEGAEPIRVDAEFELVRPQAVSGREGWEVKGVLKLPRHWSEGKYLSSAVGGKVSAVLDAKTGLALTKSYRLKAEQVREDPISMAYVKAGGEKLGYYLDMIRSEKTTYLGTGKPPALAKLQGK